jgi:hypothetical protein
VAQAITKKTDSGIEQTTGDVIVDKEGEGNKRDNNEDEYNNALDNKISMSLDPIRQMLLKVVYVSLI